MEQMEWNSGNFWKVCVQAHNYILGNLQQAGGGVVAGLLLVS